jgi:NAD(P)-dependent dehydrogenase (short-subunit alcohol dehydrogenase family)
MKYEIPAMLKTGGGAIVNTASVFGVIGVPGNEIYIASKHAIVGLTKSVAVEFGKQGIRVNAILPGVVDTDMYQRFAGDKPEVRAQWLALHPIGRIGKPDDVAEAALWLSSSKSSFVTGHSLMVDGGFTAQ